MGETYDLDTFLKVFLFDNKLSPIVTNPTQKF